VSKIIKETKHTETNWTTIFDGTKTRIAYGEKGRERPIAVMIDEANARFIVTACNNHQALVGALNEANYYVFEAWEEAEANDKSYKKAVRKVYDHNIILLSKIEKGSE